MFSSSFLSNYTAITLPNRQFIHACHIRTQYALHLVVGFYVVSHWRPPTFTPTKQRHRRYIKSRITAQNVICIDLYGRWDAFFKIQGTEVDLLSVAHCWFWPINVNICRTQKYISCWTIYSIFTQPGSHTSAAYKCLCETTRYQNSM